MEEEKKIILDLGCGNNKQEGSIGIDITRYKDVDLVMDLDKPNITLPYKEKTVDGIYAIHFLEHVINLFPLINECHRVLKAVGFMDIVVPLAPSRAAFDDPDHKRFFTKGTFTYFTPHPPGNYVQRELNGFWSIEKNDWTPRFKEDVDYVFENEMQELHIIMRPIQKI